MATLTLKIDEADKNLITDLAEAASLGKKLDTAQTTLDKVDRATTTILEGADMLILTDRMRAVDQIKRLYAVIVGFASITLLGNAVLCVRALEPGERGIEAYSILAAQVVSFFSLLILFLLGAERLLDARYLQVKSVVPGWRGLIGDVLCLLMTAGFFAVLANLLPVPSSNPPTIKLAELQTSLKIFVYVLLAIYIFDLIFVCLQKWKFERQSKRFVELKEAGAAAQQTAAADMHNVWLKTNSAAAAAMGVLTLYLVYSPPESIVLLPVCVALAVIHVGRFCYDLSKTFAFYYPKALLSSDPTRPGHAAPPASDR